jgi:type I restriction enzyme S subunit
MGYVADEPMEFVSEKIYAEWMTRGFPRKGDIFFITEGHTMGFVAVNERDEDIALAQRTITLQPFSHLHTKFFFYVMMSEIFQRLVVLNATGSAAQGIKAARLRGLPVPFPSILEQEEILRRIEALRGLADAIEKRLARATRSVDSMAQEVVTRAFRGELVPTEAELARREGRSYEAASLLLAKIRAAHEPTRLRGNGCRIEA